MSKPQEPDELDLTKEPSSSKADELDLTKEPSSSKTESSIEPSTVPYNADPARERVRGLIALSLVGTLAGVFVLSFVALMTGCTTMVDLKELLTITLGPLVALVGAATGFYYGGKK